MNEISKEANGNAWFERPFSSPYVAKIIHMEEAREIDCKICTRPYPIKPESLACGHTFCRACIEGFLMDEETLPRGRNSSDVLCPTCTKGSTVHWVIDGDGSNCKEDDFSTGAVRYDAHRKRTIQRYKNLYRAQLRYWKEIAKQEVEETFYAGKYDAEDIFCPDESEQLQTDDDDVRGIDHVSGKFINCIIECPSSRPSCVTGEYLQREISIEIEDQERHNNNVTKKDVISPETSPSKLRIKSKDTGTRSENNYQHDKMDKTKHTGMECDSHNCGDCSESQFTPRTSAMVVSDEGPLASLNRTSEISTPDVCLREEPKKIEKEKPVWGMGNGDSKNSKTDVESLQDRDERCSLDEWSAHLALIGFIITLSLVVFVASVLGT